jgi:DNA-binding response OmpR family regulator
MFSKAKILIVDDEIDTLNLMEMVLKMAGYVIVKAMSGQECLQLNREEHPDLIILDIMMPNLNGLDVLRQLGKTYGAPPVIIFSAKNQIPDVIEGMDAGAFRYLVKTASREQLLQAVKAALDYGREQKTQDQHTWGTNW